MRPSAERQLAALLKRPAHGCTASRLLRPLPLQVVGFVEERCSLLSLHNLLNLAYNE